MHCLSGNSMFKCPSKIDKGINGHNAMSKEYFFLNGYIWWFGWPLDVEAMTVVVKIYNVQWLVLANGFSGSLDISSVSLEILIHGLCYKNACKNHAIST